MSDDTKPRLSVRTHDRALLYGSGSAGVPLVDVLPGSMLYAAFVAEYGITPQEALDRPGWPFPSYRRPR